MSEGLPVVSGRDVVKALGRAGFRVVRQRGSHVRLERMYVDKIIKLTVPMHEELKRGTLRQIIADAELSVDEFVNLLR
ncbi:MAG: type II toxin-antitoxin system HicA family toxin [Nitrososphaerales archaeon]